MRAIGIKHPDGILSHAGDRCCGRRVIDRPMLRSHDDARSGRLGFDRDHGGAASGRGGALDALLPV